MHWVPYFLCMGMGDNMAIKVASFIISQDAAAIVRVIATAANWLLF